MAGEGAMRSIREVFGSDLRWSQPRALARRYELTTGAETVARLDFRSAFGTFATGECADGCWTFKRVGCFSTRVTVRSPGSELGLGEFRNNTWSRGGTLSLPDGRSYRIDVNFWMTEFQIGTESETPLITFRRIGGPLHLSSAVEVHAAAVSLPELPWLVILGWYLTVMMHADAAIVVAM